MELPTRIIYSILDDKKGIVIDVYCGSRTTLVSAKILGHDFIGIDISEEYVLFAEERLKNWKNEKRFVMEEVAKHIVLKTFKEKKERGEFTGSYRPKNKKEKSNTQKGRNLFR